MGGACKKAFEYHLAKKSAGRRMKKFFPVYVRDWQTVNKKCLLQVLSLDGYNITIRAEDVLSFTTEGNDISGFFFVVVE